MAKTKRERVILNRDKRQRRKDNLENAKSKLARYCGIGGVYSSLELVVLTCGKLGKAVRGDIHPHQQILHLSNLIDENKPAVKVSKIKTKKRTCNSRAWKILRYQAFERYGNKCCCCGGSPLDGLTMHVDHIKPKSTHPELEFDINNLQILCEDCNVGKINQWETDWRP